MEVRLLTFCLLWWLGGQGLAIAAPRFTAALDRTTISVGETATLSLTFHGGSPDQPPSVQAPAGLAINYSGQSSHFTIINGQTSSSLTHTYQVTPTRPGDYVIPAIQAVAGGVTLSSQPIRLRATKASSSPVGPGGTLNAAFAKLILPKTNVYVGEVLPVEIQLYAQNPQNLNLPQLKADGFTLGTMSNQPAQSQIQIGNAIYVVFTFRVAATPAKIGELTLGPAECGLNLRYRRARDLRDPFADFLGGGIEVRPVTVYAPAQTLQVQPLPTENRPENFGGAVGSFEVAVSASPTNAVVGDPITLKVQIAGQGALDSLALPPLSDWREFTVYPPTSKVAPTDPLGLSGVKSFEQVVIPQNAEIKELPAFSFSFFDPEKKTYRTVRHAPIAVSIRPSTVVQPQPTVLAGTGTREQPPAARDVVHIKPHFGTVSGFRPLLVQQPWFLGLQALPLAGWLAALLWRLRREKLAKDPRLRRRLRVHQIVRNGLHELRGLAAANRTEEFFATVFRLLQEQLGERLGLPATAITEAVLDEQLRERNISEALLSDLHTLFWACNEARYAPSKTAQELESLVPKVESVLHDLRELKEGTAS
ncbi:MAG: BatD family protein [Verrucomicrobia bacterium]|nr:BatD family protein [Verrucomicrobiota bacterium]